MSKEITEKEFENEVLRSKEPVLVDFWATWCPPCKALAPIIEEISKKGKIKVVKVNVDQERELAIKYRVMSIPTLMIFVDGKSTASIIGWRPQEEIEAWIDSIKKSALK